MEKKLIDDGYQHYKDRSGDSDEFTDLKLYMFLQNLLKCISCRLSIGYYRLFWRVMNLIISSLVMIMSIFGLFRYIVPIYVKSNSSLTIADLNNYDKGELPWCQITLLSSVFTPLLITFSGCFYFSKKQTWKENKMMVKDHFHRFDESEILSEV